MSIETGKTSAKYRDRMIDVGQRRLLLSRISGSEQEQDLSEPPNLGGVGRVRHFMRIRNDRWVPNPLPIDPACARLSLPPSGELTAEVFQNAACNWRCWYCYVPFDLLAALPERSVWVTMDDLIASYAALSPRPPIVDLSGGQPELTPEWVLWTMEALQRRGLDREVYLWSDDNLSVDYYWTRLSRREREAIRGYRNYGRVGCFKGIDESSFAFNTGARGDDFGFQFELFRRYIAEGLDVYAYLTLVLPSTENLPERMSSFVDRLQVVDRMLPLRTVPLEVVPFSPVTPRLDVVRSDSLRTQYDVLRHWCAELDRRFSPAERVLPVHEVRWARN